MQKLTLKRNSILIRGLLALIFGAGVWGGLWPLGSSLAGLVGALALLTLGRSLAGASFRVLLLWSALASLSVAIIAFQWLLYTISVVGELNIVFSTPLFLLHALLFNLKIPLLLLGGEFLRRRTRLSGIWYLPALACVGDLFCFQLFPWFWGNLGQGNLYLRQSAALFGVYGLSWVFFLQATLVFYFLRFLFIRLKSGQRKTLPDIRGVFLSRPFLLSGAPALLLLLSFYGYGIYKVATFPADIAGKTTVNIGYIQPNTEKGLQNRKDDVSFVTGALRQVLRLGVSALRRSAGSLDLLIIPESSIPYHGTNPDPQNSKVYSPTFHAMVALLARLGEVDILYNELDFKENKMYNAATIFGREGIRRDSYKKQVLLPFGEYLPFEDQIPLIRALFPEASRYYAANQPTLLEYKYIPERKTGELRPLNFKTLENPAPILKDWPTARPTRTGKFLPLVCYEGLFPEIVRGFFLVDPHPDFLINITNDTWFGDYLENYQHSWGVMLRSVETGRYLVRATLSGVSTVTDPLGRIQGAPTALKQSDYRVFSIPRLPESTTLYLEIGNYSVYTALLLILLAAFLRRRKSPAYKKSVKSIKSE